MEQSLTIHPIGYVRSGKGVRFKTLHQPDEAGEERSVIELTPGEGIREALRDLDGIERIWLVWWFHRNEGWRPLVLPPRGPSRRRGVFSTRSPHRPNPLGITPVRLLGIEGLRLIIGPSDLLEGTPVFDIKPYVPAYDSFPESCAGWIDDVAKSSAQPPRFTVTITPLAAEQAEWLRAAWKVDFRDRMIELLSRDPSPHRTRRIRRRPDGLLDIGCGSWRGVFRIEETSVIVTSIESSFPVRFLQELWRKEIPDREAQIAFLERWPNPALNPKAP